MSLELINLGAEANDGTGDTPRAGGLKMNAAIAVVNDLETTQGTQAGAIATLATDVDALETSQAGQDSAIATFETTTQLNDRDTANRARAGHTGTQAANTISGLATVATSGAYADLSGQPTIPVAGVLPNNTRINGVEHFYQSAKPTTRGDSSALVVGDRWWKVNDGTEWGWNGTYWVSSIEFVEGANTTLAQASGNATSTPWGGIPVKDKLITRIGWIARTDALGLSDVSNYLQFDYQYIKDGIGTYFTFDTFRTSNSSLIITNSISLVHAEKISNWYEGNSAFSFRVVITEVGTVGNWANGTNRSYTYVAYRKVFL